jgi:SAM-dependent methyltransferase
MDTWDDGNGYEPYVGRWSRPVAGEFLTWLDVERGSRWLDVGCGTGALLGRIVESASPTTVSGIDSSDGFLATARGFLGDFATLQVADARDLPFDDDSFDAVVSGLVLNFVPEPGVAVTEMRRVAEPGGVVGVYVWDYAGKMELMRYFWDAVVALDPGAVILDEGERFPLCHPDALAELFTDAGFRDVATRPIDVPTRFSDFDDYWSPFLLAQGPAPSYVASLSDTDRGALEEHLRTSVPTRPDGAIDMVARAWAVSGTA